MTDRAKLEEESGSGFVQCDRKAYRNKMPDQVHNNIFTNNLNVDTNNFVIPSPGMGHYR